MSNRRIGAYLLPGDTTWLEKSVRQYYPLLDALVVAVPIDARGWTGAPIPVRSALAVVEDIDSRGLRRQITGTWTDRRHPMRADTAQRQAALDALAGEVDWVIQLDNDEFLPDPEALLAAIDEADRRGLPAVEWPMRVLFRRTRGHMFEVVGANGEPRYDYPGPIAVRPGVRLVDARRAASPFLRVVVQGDRASLQLTRTVDGEQRWDGITHVQAILHNSWARSPSAIWQKTRAWGHASGWRGVAYFLLRWLPAPLTWRFMRDVHPFATGLWPRVERRPLSREEVDR